MTNSKNLLSQFFNNPLFARAQQMADGKSIEELQQIAANICKEKGLDIDKMMQQFQALFNK